MEYLGASSDMETLDDFVKERSYDGGFYITPHGTALMGSSHLDIILEFQSELDIPNDEYDTVLRTGSGSDALEKLSQSLLRRGNIYVRLWDNVWIVMLFRLNDRKKDYLYDLARDLIDAGANERDEVQIQDLRTKWIGSLTLEDMARYRFGERKGSKMRTLSQEVMSAIQECRGEGGCCDKDKEKKPWMKDEEEDEKDEAKKCCKSKGGVPSLFKKDNKDALGSKASAVARKQSKKM